jgi:hypothetical protein
VLGDVDLTWRDESRLYSIELRTGGSQWEPSSLRIPSESVEESSMTLAVEYDVNRVASIDGAVRVLWDATQACVAQRFSNAEPDDGRWAAIADNVLVCVDDEQMPPGTTRWPRNRRRPRSAAAVEREAPQQVTRDGAQNGSRRY